MEKCIEKTGDSSKLSRLVRRLYIFGVRHPVISAAIYCFFCGIGTACRHSFMTPFYPLFVICSIIYPCIYIYGKYRPAKRNMIIITAVTSVLVIMSAGLVLTGKIGLQIVRSLIMFGILCAMALLWKKGRLSAGALLSLILITGFVLRVLAVLDFNIIGYQHDLCSFSNSADEVTRYFDRIILDMTDKGAGHAAYIEYILHYGMIPDFDMRNVWSFYNPPFFHIVSAIWLRFAMLFTDYSSACESIQTISLFSSIAIMLLSYKLFRMLRLRKAGLVIATAYTAFSNAIIQLAMNVNNDPLSTFLMLGAVLYTLSWYRKPGFRNIILIAVFLGLGMMTKLSAAIIAPAIAFVFLFVFIKNIRNIRAVGRNIAQFAVFLLICAPLGLFYQVRNLIRFGIPLTYIQVVNDMTPEQYIGDTPVLQRLFGGWNIYLPWVYSKSSLSERTNFMNETNPLMCLVKTSLFEEFRQNLDLFYMFDIFGSVLIIASLIVIAVGVGKMFSLIRTARRGEGVQLWFMLIAFVSMVLSYYIFCFNYPYLCSQHIRYVMLTIVSVGFYLGRLVQDVSVVSPTKLFSAGKYSSKEKYRSICAYIVCVLVAIIAAGSMMIF